jgi:hypothetical protein
MSAALLIRADLATVLALWGAPGAGPRSRGNRALSAKELLRRELEPGVHTIEVPEGAAWGGLFDPECKPPLLIGAFRVLDGPQGVRVVRRPAGPYLEGEGVLELLGPREFDRTLNAIRAAGLRLDADGPFSPPVLLWWARVGPIARRARSSRGTVEGVAWWA